MSTEVDFVLVEVLYALAPGLGVSAGLEILEQTFEMSVSVVGRAQAWQVCSASASDFPAVVSSYAAVVVISGG